MHDLTIALEIAYLQTASLKPDPPNPRVHSDIQVGHIARSIESFGFNVPILVDEQQKVIAGHGRLLAARKLGWATVPSIRLSHLTEAQRAAFLVADNRLTENSAYDERMLGERLKILSDLDLDFNLEVIGLKFLRSISSSTVSTQHLKTTPMIEFPLSRNLRSPFSVIFGSWASIASSAATR